MVLVYILQKSVAFVETVVSKICVHIQHLKQWGNIGTVVVCVSLGGISKSGVQCHRNTNILFPFPGVEISGSHSQPRCWPQRQDHYSPTDF